MAGPAIFFDVSGNMDDIVAHNNRMRGVLAAAGASAATGTARAIRRAAQKELVADLRLPPRKVSARMRVFRATRRSMRATLRVLIRHVNPAGLNARPTRHGVRAGAHAYERAWLWRPGSGSNPGVILQRELGAPREPYGPVFIEFAARAVAITNRHLMSSASIFRRLLNQRIEAALRRRGYDSMAEAA